MSKYEALAAVNRWIETSSSADFLKNFNKLEGQYSGITIGEDYFDELLNDALFLNILEAHGVDNWEGYSEAQAEHYPDDEDE